MSDIIAQRRLLIADRGAYESVVEREDRRSRMWYRSVFMILIGALIAVYIHMRTRSLQYTYNMSYLWWRIVNANNSYSRTKVTVPGVAMKVEFPAYYWFQELRMNERTISRAGAEFLLLMTTHFSRNMTRRHWDGNSEELRLDDLKIFLPPNARSEDGTNWAAVWHSFNSRNANGDQVNPWSGVLWSTIRAMANSPAIQDYYGTHNKAPNRGLIESLYRGGLVEVAITHGSSVKTGTELVRYLMGSVPTGTTSESCAGLAQRASSAAEYGSLYGIGGTMVLMNGKPTWGRFAVALAAVATGAMQGAITC